MSFHISVVHTHIGPDGDGFSRGPTVVGDGGSMIVQCITCSCPFDGPQVNALGDTFTFETNEDTPVTLFTVFVGPGAGKFFNMPVDWLAGKGLVVTAPDGGHVTVCHGQSGA